MTIGMWTSIGCVDPAGPAVSSETPTTQAANAEPVTPAKRPNGFYPIGVRYFIEPHQPMDDQQLLETAAEDFTRFREWGFNCVLIEQAQDGPLQVLLREASNKRLKVLLTTRSMFHYIHFGELPAGTSTVNEFASDYVETFANRSNVVMHVLPWSRSPVASERRATVERILRQLDPDRQVISVGGPGPMRFVDPSTRLAGFQPGEGEEDESAAKGVHPEWLVKYVEALRQQADAVPLGQRYLLLPTTIPWPEGQKLNPDWWRLIYHECVAAGWTDGVIFERYRSTATGRGGLLDLDRSMTTSRSAVIKRLTAGMLEWGDRLRGMAVVVRTAADDPSPIQSAYFVRGQRRLLLVFNRRYDIFSNGDVPVLGHVETRAISRAIDIETGMRHFRKGTDLAIPVRLKPADAKFFELF